VLPRDSRARDAPHIVTPLDGARHLGAIVPSAAHLDFVTFPGDLPAIEINDPQGRIEHESVLIGLIDQGERLAALCDQNDAVGSRSIAMDGA
jgi:hypothetical protein